jgi:hypothetical protein
VYLIIELRVNIGRLFITIISGIVLVYITLRFIDIEIFDVFIYRFSQSSNDINSLTTGRNVLWLEYISAIFNDAKVFLIGVGINGKGLSKAAHNTYLEITYLFGILGMITFILYIWSSIKIVSTKVSAMNITPLVIFLLTLSSLSAFTYNNFWVLICLVGFSLSKRIIK